MSTRLMVLGLLHAAPLHGYDIRKRLDTLHAAAWADVLPGSIYHALKQMEKEGLLAVEATERSGNRLRAVYALTDAGRRAYLDELRRAWAAPPRAFPTGLYAAIAFLDDLPHAEATALIDALVPALEREIAYWAEGEAAKGQAGALSAPTRAVFANARERMEADLRLLRRLRAALVSAEAPTTGEASHGAMP
jgi:DNA-binding PadR family transcriptional regulator